MPSPSFRVVVASFLAALVSVARADGFDIFSRHEELRGHVIVDMGDFEKVGSKFGSVETKEILKLKSDCYEVFGALGTWGYSKKAGLVVMNRERSIKIAILESNIGSIKMQTSTATRINCPGANSEGMSNDVQQKLQELKRMQDQLQKELERTRHPK